MEKNTIEFRFTTKAWIFLLDVSSDKDCKPGEVLIHYLDAFEERAGQKSVTYTTIQENKVVFDIKKDPLNRNMINIECCHPDCDQIGYVDVPNAVEAQKQLDPDDLPPDTSFVFDSDGKHLYCCEDHIVETLDA